MELLHCVYKTGEIRQPERPDLPGKVHIKLRPPPFMEVAFRLLHGGTEELIAQGSTKGAIEAFLKLNDITNHIRFTELTITGPDFTETRTRRK